MKTNHNRGFVARPEANSRIEPIAGTVYQTFPGHQSSWSGKLALSGKKIHTYIHPNGGTHSEEKCRRGAKRHINRVARHHENAATKRLADDTDSD